MTEQSVKRAAQEYLAERLCEEGLTEEQTLNRDAAIALAPLETACRDGSVDMPSVECSNQGAVAQLQGDYTRRPAGPLQGQSTPTGFSLRCQEAVGARGEHGARGT